MDNTISFQEQEMKLLNKEEEEEALSLCDFPLNSNETDRKDCSKPHHHRRSSSQLSDFFEFSNDLKPHHHRRSSSQLSDFFEFSNDLKPHHHRRSSSQLSDFFEFSNDLNSENMSHAEDIISCGKLVPYQQQQPFFDDQILKSVSEDYDSINLSRRYCDSLPELNPTRSNSSSSSTTLTRSSRSLDSKKLRRNSSLVMKSEASDVHWIFKKGSVKSDGSKGSKPRWYDLIFGQVKFPPEMDLRDMKNRLVRRNPGSMFPAVEAGGRAPANRSDRRSSWGHDLLSVLSCKNHQSVAVTASIALVPQL